MPTKNKTQWAKLKVGVMTIVALFLLAGLIFLLTGGSSPFTSKSVIYTYIQDSNDLAVSSPVRLNGIVVGKVKSIMLSGLPDLKKTVRLDLEVEDRFFPAIPADSVAGIGAGNVLGTKFINISKGVGKISIQPGGTLNAKDTSDFNDIIEQGNNMLLQLQALLKRVDAVVSVVEQGKGSIGKLLVDEELYNRLIATVAEVQSIATALNKGNGTLGKLVNDDAMYNDVRKSMARIDALLEGIQQGQGSAGKLIKDPALYDQSTKAIVDLRNLLAEIDSGKGTIGKLIKSDEMHARVLGTIGKVDGMLDKVNSGQGTIGQLLVNQQLYDNLNGTTKEVHELMKDFRSNPKKFLKIQLHLF